MRTAHIDFGSVMAALPWLLLMLLILSYGLPLGDSEGLRANSGAANAVVRRGEGAGEGAGEYRRG